MASNPGQIPAGGKDKISVVVNTGNRGESTLHKRFDVHTNDPSKPRTQLVVTGPVQGYLTLKPRYVRLMGRLDEPLSMTVKILPKPDHPFSIKSVTAKKGEYIRYDLKPLGKNPARDGYHLIITNTKKDAGAYRDIIVVETDLKQKPSLRITVTGRIHNPPPDNPKKSPN